jgi:hypothetical protein
MQKSDFRIGLIQNRHKASACRAKLGSSLGMRKDAGQRLRRNGASHRLPCQSGG